MLLDYIIENKDEILSIFEKYGAHDVTIIGSVAKRKETRDSDIDFVANLKKFSNKQTDLESHAHLIDELRNFFKRDIDLTSYEQITEQFPDELKRGVKL